MVVPRALHVLLVEDNEDDARLLSLELRRSGFAPEIERVETAEAMASALGRGGFDVVLSDYRLPAFGAPEALELYKRSGLDAPFLVCSGSIGETQAVDLLKAGANDFFLKDNLARMGTAIDRELREVESRRARLRAEREREHAERALRESEALLRAFFDSPGAMRGLVELLEDDVRFLMVNELCAASLHRVPSEVVGRRAAELGVPRSVTATWTDHCRRGRETAAGVTFDYEQEPERGTRIRAVVTHVPGAASGRDRFTFIARDVTEEWRAQQELRESEERFRLVVEASPCGILAADAGGRIILVNQRTEHMFGYPRSELLGQPLERLVPEAARAAHEVDRTALRRHPASGPVAGAQAAEGRRRDGGTFPVEVGLSHFDSRDGPVALAAVVDVTERHALEEQLRGAQRMEAVGRLAGGIAHDFNNLLGVISGFGELAQRQLPPDHPIQRRLEQILRASGRAAELTRQLLAFSRNQPMQARPLDLNAAIESTWKMLERVIGEDIKLASRLDPQLGTVMADPSQIDQVVMNLAVNARDAMSEGGTLYFETANVELDEDYVRRHVAGSPGSYVMLAVSDTGVGMDAETRSHIFEPFFTTKLEQGGTGLGLATVYGIVKQNGGFIWVYSEPGRGATFRIYLPRVAAAAEAAAGAEHAEAAPRGTETVLVVEDQEGLREMIREILEEQGYTVLAAADGDEALELARRHPGPIPVLLTDVIMPGMNGRELADRIAALRPETRAVYMSGYSGGSIEARGLLADGVSLVQKPFSATALARAIRKALEP